MGVFTEEERGRLHEAAVRDLEGIKKILAPASSVRMVATEMSRILTDAQYSLDEKAAARLKQKFFLLEGHFTRLKREMKKL